MEWKFGLAKLIRNMERTNLAPAPINLFTTVVVLMYTKYVHDRKEKKMARIRFREAMRDEMMKKAPGMKFLTDLEVGFHG